MNSTILHDQVFTDSEDHQTMYEPVNIENHTSYSNNSDHIDKWFLMESPWPILGLAGFYLLFVLRIGPSMMSNKQALNLKPVILLYNFIQVIFSSWWTIKILNTLMKSGTFSFIKSACTPHSISPEISYEIDTMAWYYLMSKYVELLDTVFFVLRRKQSQVTFLHVYHHTNMAVSTWAFIKFVKSVQVLPIGICNSIVHVMMYGYYMLAALGPKVHKYLWWKKYITRAQISQFLIILLYLGFLLGSECTKPSAFIVFALFNTSSFLILFYKFYLTSYYNAKSTNQKLEVKQIVKNNNYYDKELIENDCDKKQL